MTERDLERLAEAGVYRPSHEDAAEQRALLEGFLAGGITVEQLVAANRLGNLVLLAFGHLILPGPRLTLEEAAAAAGALPGELLRVRRAFGLPDPSPGERACTPADVEAFRFVGTMTGTVGPEPALDVARAVGTAMSRIAEAEIALVRSQLEAPMQARGESAASMLLGYAAVLETFPPAVLRAMDAVHRAHLVHIGRRYSEWAPPPSEHNVLDLVVGFADVSQSTTLVQRLDLASLERAIARFEEVTSDRIAAAGATLVKRLGDGVMFVTPRPALACVLALDLVAAFRDGVHATPVRVGLAAGRVAALRGDFFGPAVHQAARIVSLAQPATVLVSDDVRRRVEGERDLVFRAIGGHVLAGFDGTVELYGVERA